MTLQRILFLIGALALVFVFGNAEATPRVPEDLSVFLEQQITRMETGAMPATASDEASSQDDSMYFLRRFWLRVRAKAAFKIPGMVKIQVVPEVEVLWERPLPDGWTGYKPK